eukprot:TRINITY_DN64755_c0_g4_i1.p1 TRINITY_DN64755_c0_g4~~TRINITY_DN64755_c0_g4_i1.p1  ORF type:complete len:574 (-),score=51.00 TRINITY_DN64755_c0_g4_i1:165-1886(-)
MEVIPANVFKSAARTVPVQPPDDPELAKLSDEIYKLICPYSLEIMSDPRTLPCGHTLDYSSLVQLAEEGRGTITCPVCRAKFEADPVNLDVNLVTKQILEGIRGLNNKTMVLCDRCSKRVAKIACQDCGMLYCQTCFDIVHQGKLSEHRWNYLDVAVQRDLPYCSVPGHEEYRLDLYCPTTNEFICLMCQATTHRSMEVYPVMQAAHYAKEDLQDWIAESGRRKRKLKSVTEAIDKVISGLEQRADDELHTLEELVTAFIDKIEAQAKVVSDKIIEHKITEVDKLCDVRKQIVSHIANMVDDIARAERAINLSDAIELVLMDREIIKNPPPLTIHLPQYSIPWVGPEGSFDQLFAVDFLPAQDPCWLDPIFQDIVVPPLQIADKPTEMKSEGTTKIGTAVTSDFKWGLDIGDKGAYVSVSADCVTATTGCPDCYDNSSVVGDVCMESGIWYWKVKFQDLSGSKQVCFGVCRKPFDHNNPKPYKVMWGWSTNGCALPSYETRNHEAKVRSGDEVWIKFDADVGKVEAYWPSTGMSGNIDIGVKAMNKRMFPVFVLGRRGNTITVEPGYWDVPEE